MTLSDFWVPGDWSIGSGRSNGFPHKSVRGASAQCWTPHHATTRRSLTKPAGGTQANTGRLPAQFFGSIRTTLSFPFGFFFASC